MQAYVPLLLVNFPRRQRLMLPAIRKKPMRPPANLHQEYYQNHSAPPRRCTLAKDHSNNAASN